MAVGLLLFGLLIIFLLCGFPIAVCIGAASVFTFLQAGLPLQNFISKFYANINSFTLMAVPFFMFAGALMSTGGMSKRLVRLARAFVGWMSGGLAHVVIIASAFFAALSGSAPATCAAIGGMMIPEMKKNGYPAEFSAAVQCVAGTIGTIIPPSIPMVVYSISAGCSVGAMFAAGFLPGILYALCLMGYSAWVCKKEGIGKESYQTFSWSEVWAAFKDAIWALLVPVIILGGIYSGIFTPTEAGAVAAVYGLFAGVCIYRELKFKDVINVLVDSAANTSMVLLIIGVAGAFSWLLTITGVAAGVGNFFTSVATNRITFMLMAILLMIFMGCFMECCASILIITPLLLPVAQSLGIDPIHFGIVVVMTLSLGMATPPVGEDLYISASIAGIKFEKMLKYAVPLMFMALVAVLVTALIPAFPMLLPHLFYG